MSAVTKRETILDNWFNRAPKQFVRIHSTTKGKGLRMMEWLAENSPRMLTQYSKGV